MNFNDQKKYIIAAFVSLIFHFLILIINLPRFSISPKIGLETFQAGMVEIASGSLREGRVYGPVSLPPKGPDISTARYNPASGQPDASHNEIKADFHSERSVQNATIPVEQEKTVPGNALKKLDDTHIAGGNIETKPNISPNPILPNTTALPKKGEGAVSGNPAGPPGNQSIASGKIAEVTDAGKSEAGQTQVAKSQAAKPESGKSPDLGTGEEMVIVLGPMPIYPPQARKEGKEGNVAVRVLVNAGGHLMLPIITRSSGDIRLDHATVTSIERQWKFKSINKGYYIDLGFSFNIKIGVSVKFLGSKIRK